MNALRADSVPAAVPFPAKLSSILYRGVLWLFLAGVACQFLLAGLGVLGGGSIDPHRILGFLLMLLGVVQLVLALVGRLGRRVIAMSVALVVLLALQAFFANPTLSPVWLRSLHVLGAFAVTGVAFHLARRASLS